MHAYIRAIEITLVSVRTIWLEKFHHLVDLVVERLGFVFWSCCFPLNGHISSFFVHIIYSVKLFNTALLEQLSDGPNEIVAEWMDLLCNLVTLHLLACRMPQKAILQVTEHKGVFWCLLVFTNRVYSNWKLTFQELVWFVKVYTAAYSAVNGSDPPHRQQIVNFIHAFSSNPAARLQSEFTHYGPRLRQVTHSWILVIMFHGLIVMCINLN